MKTTTRRAWFAASAIMALGLGAAVGWQRWRPQAPADGVAERLWASTLNTVDGVAAPLATWRGQPTLVNFWATWCPPCVEEMPMLDAFYQQHAGRCHILGLAVDQPKAVQRFLQKQPIQYPLLMAGSAGLSLSRDLGNEAGGLPFSVFLDASGAITKTKVGKISQNELDDWLA
jgi:thiol-disulfide isomerase/thioredoxin